MAFLGKLPSLIAKKPVTTQISADVLASQKTLNALFNDNLKNVQDGIPDVVKSQKEALKGLTALSEQIKATLPK